jgi:hypothetical protein
VVTVLVPDQGCREGQGDKAIKRSNLVVQRSSIPVIAGSGRSGTTWVLDALAEANGLRPVFEPLYPGTSPVAERYHSRYLEPSQNEPQLRDYLTRIFERRETNSFSDYRISPASLRLDRKKFESLRALRQYISTLRTLHRRRSQFGSALRRHKAIVKFIRANWLLPWMLNHFEAAVVLIVRHPAAVADSQLRNIEHWEPDARLSRLLESQYVRESYRHQLDRIDSKFLSTFGRLVTIWCIENAVPVRVSQSFGYSTVFYEDLKDDYPQTWRRLTDALGLSEIPEESSILRPSQQSSLRWQQNDGIGGRVDPTAWRRRLGDTEKSEFEYILGLFDVDYYEWDDDRPSGFDRLEPADG